MGISFRQRIFVVLGKREHVLPLLHVDDAADAIVACLFRSVADNQVFNVLDHNPTTKQKYIERAIRPRFPNAFVVYCPIRPLVAIVWIQEKVLTFLGRRPFLTAYRLVSSQKPVRYSTLKFEQTMGWRPRAGFKPESDYP
jgi:nucleoside-diphosphate-sugar epimerase